MPNSTLQSIRRYQSISMFGGGIVVTILILIACGLGMASIVYGYLNGERRNFANGMEETFDEIQVSETSFRNGVANTQLIWRELGPAPRRIVNDFFDNNQQLAITPYPSLVVGVPGQTDARAEVARYLSLSFILSRICAASSLNRGRVLEGYHYSTRTGLFGLVPHLSRENPALATPAARAGVLEALRVDFAEPRSASSPAQPRVHWLPPYVNPVTGRTRIRIAAEAVAEGEPFAVLVTEYAPDYLLSWLAERTSEGTFFITTADNRLVAMDPAAAAVPGLAGRLLGLDVAHAGTAAGAPLVRDGFVVFRGALGKTGWTIAYALSWSDIASGIGVQAGALAASTLVAIAVMWWLLIRFFRRVLIPVYARSQRVFDSEDLCRHVVEMAPVGIGLVSLADRRIMLASTALTEIAARFGGDRAALSEQIVDRYEAFLSSGGADGAMRVNLLMDVPGAGMDAEPMHLEVIARGARYQGDVVLIAAVVDATAKQQFVRKLEEAVRAADSSNAAKSSFLAAMSHEIRTPLNVILGNLELLSRSALDASQQSRVQTLRTSAEGLLAIVSDVLDFSKIEAGAMSVESIEFDVMAVVERELAAFAPVAKAKGLQLLAEIDACGAQRMRGDPTRLGQVFANLLSNAIKFTSEGRVTARLSVRRDAHGVSGLALEVEDTGIGIPDEQRQKLFKAFSQVDASITRRYGGSGLGLALCDRLVTAMGGAISVVSAPGIGSRFTVRLPLGTEIDADPASGAFAGRTLILVAAENAWRTFARPHLERWGFEVVVHRSPTQIAAASRARAHAIVLFGDSDTWRRAELDSLHAGAAPIVFATPDGPLQPYVAGTTIRVSGYSLTGLLAAMTLAAATPGERWVVPEDGYARRKDARGERPLRVLLAGDPASGSSMLREQLDALGCTVAETRRGDAVLDRLASSSWDMLLLGGDLPDMRASALAQAVRERGLSCVVVAVVSYLMPDDADRYAAAEVAQIMTMPVTLAQLKAVLTRVARRQGAHAGSHASRDERVS
ncbi:ATP-binding protein [Burkholderia cenocepacia]|uniref:ATP-binding protein n=1 Tax=Burkholderia cenocepacia TaxID=95486 RepID=UPI0005C735A7|nr:ATP-binding protein [Burkholderia cenocepacia]